EGLARISAEEFEDAVDAVVLVDLRQQLDLLADEDFVERLAAPFTLAKLVVENAFQPIVEAGTGTVFG
ncbi:hypothetical protein AB9F45_39115, partial [Rhizobium leguminosarum]|uniref:hypothetical protein n=1 Tax=Rhizobium leguminosarum TaxID=384 RepID=UPI003F9D832E